jgi:hypothetical protein
MLVVENRVRKYFLRIGDNISQHIGRKWLVRADVKIEGGALLAASFLGRLQTVIEDTLLREWLIYFSFYHHSICLHGAVETDDT